MYSLLGGCVKARCHQSGDSDNICTDSIEILKPDFTTYNIGKLPIRVKFHTLTKISETEFILCGGKNPKYGRISDVYFGRLSLYDGESIQWEKLKSLNQARAKHCSMYMGNRLVVIGGVREPTLFDKLSWEDIEYLKLNRLPSAPLKDISLTENFRPFNSYYKRKGWKNAGVNLIKITFPQN